jgi:hypothetical protein
MTAILEPLVTFNVWMGGALTKPGTGTEPSPAHVVP